MPNGNGYRFSGMVVASFLATIVALSTLVAAWDTLGLPKVVFREDLEVVLSRIGKVQTFARGTRRLLLQDQLWRKQLQIGELEREAEGYTKTGQPVPNWLTRELFSFRTQMEVIRSSLTELETLIAESEKNAP